MKSAGPQPVGPHKGYRVGEAGEEGGEASALRGRWRWPQIFASRRSAAMTVIVLLFVGACVAGAVWFHADASPDLPPEAFEDEADERDQQMHAAQPERKSVRWEQINYAEYGAAFWYESAQRRLMQRLAQRELKVLAKNVILFLGDGMSIPTLAAARIYQGQLQNRTGEEEQLFFEKFPYAGLAKTYCVDHQVAESACAATAYLCGVKANSDTVGVTAAVRRDDWVKMLNTSHHVTSILHWAQEMKKSTGIVTNTRVTHASPAGSYAHSASREWESDADVGSKVRGVFQDIAQQLIFGDTGKNFKVILGGGRRAFLPNNETDPEGNQGSRLDGQNLIEEWERQKMEQGSTYQYVWNRTGLQDVHYENNEYLLGLFKPSHMLFNLEDKADDSQPTLAEMTTAAIRTVSKNKKGFVLFIEGGRIDHAHHNTKATLALDETLQLAEAIQRATELTKEEETLIVVTADHSHTMSISGSPPRGSDILDIAGRGADKLPYTTLSYANGPNYDHSNKKCRRRDPTTDVKLGTNDYRFPAGVPKSSETHGGDDVIVLSRGPFAHLLTGVFEQNYIPHAMAYAACIGKGTTACDGICYRRRSRRFRRSSLKETDDYIQDWCQKRGA